MCVRVCVCVCDRIKVYFNYIHVSTPTIIRIASACLSAHDVDCKAVVSPHTPL